MKQAILALSFIICHYPSAAQERLIVVNEGVWQTDNGRLTYFEDGKVVSNQWFRDQNGAKLGDTPNDIVQVNDDLVAIALNWSNIVQFITPDGKAVAATGDVPNNRCLCTDGSYVYVTSYGHECTTVGGTLRFERGFVAKIDAVSHKVLGATEVGYEPEGIAIYRGHLFVANSGGYAAQEAGHDYETTVSVVDAATMQVVRTIDTGIANLYGKVSQSGRYLCINSPGDYYDHPSCGIILDCEAALGGSSDCFVKLNFPVTYSTVAADGSFLTVGSAFSYATGESRLSCMTIAPEAVVASGGSRGVAATLPGTLSTDIAQMSQPYGIYVNPYTGYIYATDAVSYESMGYLYQWSPDGRLQGKHKVYINPGHFLALPPNGRHFEPGGSNSEEQPNEPTSRYIKAVDEYVPAPGQFVNTLPPATAADTPQTMADKCTARIGGGNGQTVTLGGYGGYITFHFDHPLVNVPGAMDLYIAGNAHEGNSEAGIVMVSQDVNGNGLPDDPWYELSGSADEDSIGKVVYGYEIAYTRDGDLHDVPWRDSRAGSGTVPRNSFHQQEYFPLWLGQSLTFNGTLLPSNASISGSTWVLQPLRYGYADNKPNSDSLSCCFNLEWAVDPVTRQHVTLSHADFIRVYTALNQVCGWIGETSTEITGAEDLHPEATTGIEAVLNSKHANRYSYDLQGRRTANRKSRIQILITNGKKYFY